MIKSASLVRKGINGGFEMNYTTLISISFGNFMASTFRALISA